jgi:hypothetical protein
MDIREATKKDAQKWNDFVNDQGGSFHQYFGWKYVYEKAGMPMTLLLMEDGQFGLKAVCSYYEEKHKLYSILYSWGSRPVLFKQGLSTAERNQVTRAFISYIDKHHPARTARFVIVDSLPLDYREELDQGLLQSGCHVSNDYKSGVPCTSILPLQAPFEEHVWRKFTHKYRQAMNRVQESGVKVICDRELKYLDLFADYCIGNYKRHSSHTPNRDYFLTPFKVFDNIRLWAALDDKERIQALAAVFYSPATCYFWELGTPEKDTDNISKYLHKVMIEHACNEGCRYVDFLGAYSQGLAEHKKRYGAQQTPMVEYQKRYSTMRYILEAAPPALKYLVTNPKYLWSRLTHR